jgi:hypothetical protein
MQILIKNGLGKIFREIQKLYWVLFKQKHGNGMYSKNPNITWDIIQENPDKPWSWDNISQNNFYHDPFFNPIYTKKEKQRNLWI